MKWVPQRERLKREKIVCWLIDSLYLFSLPFFYSPLSLHLSFQSLPIILPSLPALHLSLLSTTYFSPPLSVIAMGRCTRIHLIKCTHTHTTLTDILLSCSKMNVCVDWITSHLSQDPLYLVNEGAEREKGKQMKIKWKHSSEREKLIILFACWCRPFNSTLCWAAVKFADTEVRISGHTHTDIHPHTFSYLEFYSNVVAQLCLVWWLCLTQQNTDMAVNNATQCFVWVFNLSSHHASGHDI